MKYFVAFIFVGSALLVAGCTPSFIDDPPARSISGRVIRQDTGAPVANATIAFQSGRKRGLCLLPWDTFGIDAMAATNGKGEFALVAKLNGQVHVFVQDKEFFQNFDLPAFPESNRIDGILWKLYQNKPDHLPLPTPASDTPAVGAPVAPPSGAAGR
jgi:hypothetical protein